MIMTTDTICPEYGIWCARVEAFCPECGQPLHTSEQPKWRGNGVIIMAECHNPDCCLYDLVTQDLDEWWNHLTPAKLAPYLRKAG